MICAYRYLKLRNVVGMVICNVESACATKAGEHM